MCILYILFPVLIGLICAFLGYQLGRLSSKDTDAPGKLHDELEAWRKESAVPLPVPFDTELAASVFLKKITEDDLKIVEGIGPKIEELLHNAGIRTWKALSETSVEKCQQILDNAGERFRIHKPSTWPKQSELAYLGKWNELKQWQDQMTGGR